MEAGFVGFYFVSNSERSEVIYRNKTDLELVVKVGASDKMKKLMASSEEDLAIKDDKLPF